jgi:hypothetical protein
MNTKITTLAIALFMSLGTIRGMQHNNGGVYVRPDDIDPNQETHQNPLALVAESLRHVPLNFDNSDFGVVNRESENGQSNKTDVKGYVNGAKPGEGDFTRNGKGLYFPR